MNFVVSVPVNENLASFIGKKGSDEGLIFYNRKMDQDVIVAIMPTNNEKIYYNMAESMLISGQIVVSTETVDKFLGEVLVAASLIDRHVIIMDDNDVSKIVNGIIKDFEISGKDELLAKITSRREQHDGDVRIDIDKAFPVKGIGTVLLGVVTRGRVKVHDALYHSSGKQITIKSIQSQDVDVSESGYGTRVGLAVKGIEYEEVDKGDILMTKKFIKPKSILAEVKLSSFANERMEQQKRYTFISNFSRTVAIIDEVDGQNMKMTFEKPISVMEGDSFMLVREQTPRIFASGRVKSSG